MIPMVLKKRRKSTKIKTTDYRAEHFTEKKNKNVCEKQYTENREKVLKEYLELLEDNYDYIIIDCMPSLGMLTINALSAADSVLIPIQTEFYALEGVSQLVKTITIVQQTSNKDLVIEGVLLTMFDGRTNLSVQVADEVKSFFGTKVYKTIIPRNVRLSEAPSYGEPIIVYDPKSKGAAVYTKLAKEVIRDSKKTK